MTKASSPGASARKRTISVVIQTIPLAGRVDGLAQELMRQRGSNAEESTTTINTFG